MEGYINQIVLFKSKKCLPSNPYVKSLLLEDIPEKEFKTKQQMLINMVRRCAILANAVGSAGRPG